MSHDDARQLASTELSEVREERKNRDGGVRSVT